LQVNGAAARKRRQRGGRRERRGEPALPVRKGWS